MRKQIDIDPNYESLFDTLMGSYEQAANGKGKVRHAFDEPFERQQIVQLAKWVGGSPAAGCLFQATKKTIESARLDRDRAIAELRGATNYLQAAIILLEELEAA